MTNVHLIFMGFMAIVNIISIFLLGGTAIKALRNYEEQQQAAGRPSPQRIGKAPGFGAGGHQAPGGPAQKW